ncbi:MULTISPECIES: putative urea ABC transporter substrate-binding protein [Spiribacter]|jgi:NitT/TauT family transport system substrate-binding protein|uniref:Urea ABC transporter substrate-binding protein n=1 Tax=Spiribacter roseus TaxID=1855875 RepID=A0ABV3RXM4_9GAMM|nr:MULTISPECIES: putative urea ABC transporter substrate-binding protein [Spiribacter]PZA01069.1 lipid kinase [Gammaproteobacteria bacterium 2W06]
MKRPNRTRSTARRVAGAGLLAAMLALPGLASAQEKDSFRIAWSIYVGWMPWSYGDSAGIVDKWADRYDIEIDVVQINDYIESINLYTAGEFDGVTITNMDALAIPAASGVDTTLPIIGDFSNGNDGVVLKDTDELTDIEGQRVNLVELSVSHYLLARALESVGMSERDVTVVNTSDADIVGTFSTPDVTAAVTWNPQLSELRAMPEANVVFDSSDIPGEIIDTLALNTEVLEANPELGKALTGAWYEIMARMSGDDETGVDARTRMAEAAGTDLAGYEAQLASTQMFYDAADAVEFVTSDQPEATMDNVRQFAYDRGLLGATATSPDFVGIEFTDGSVLGSEDNVKLRFTSEYMEMAAEDAL